MHPDRQPVIDRFRGVVLRFGATSVLARTPQGADEVVISGDLEIRYGVEVLGKPHLSIVPGLVALDYGDMLNGEEAWDFLLRGSHLHPRADVIGYRSDGVDDMTVIKALDLAQPVHVLVYEDAAATLPVARVTALIASDTETIAPRLLEHLLHYPSVTEWQASQNG